MRIEQQSISEEQALAAGKAAAEVALARSEDAIFAADELTGSKSDTAFAMGWNSVWASDENRRRCARAAVTQNTDPGQPPA
jgi:hypothetical protein